MSYKIKFLVCTSNGSAMRVCTHRTNSITSTADAGVNKRSNKMKQLDVDVSPPASVIILNQCNWQIASNISCPSFKLLATILSEIGIII